METVSNADEIKPEGQSYGLQSKEGNRTRGGMMYGWF